MCWQSCSKIRSHCTVKNIWTNGCFDIVHIGHMKLFEYARSLGDKLIVGIDSDSRIKKYKYPNQNRPLNNEKDRLEFLRGIKYIDEVSIFYNHDYMMQLIKHHNIDTIVVGDDYEDEYVVGSELVNNVIFFPKIKNKSSSKILANL